MFPALTSQARRWRMLAHTLACVAWLLGSALAMLPLFWATGFRRAWLLRFFRFQSAVILAALRPAVEGFAVVRGGVETGVSPPLAEPCPPPAPCLYVANHQSVLDPFAFAWLGVGPVVFVAKSWPFRLPFYGPYLRGLGLINTAGLDFAGLCEAVAGRLAQGNSVVFFPEGSRRVALGRFHSLPFHVATRLGCAIVPVCIDGHARLLPPGGRIPQAARVRYTFLPPIRPDEFCQGEEAPLRLAQEVRRQMAEALREGNAPA